MTDETEPTTPDSTGLDPADEATTLRPIPPAAGATPPPPPSWAIVDANGAPAAPAAPVAPVAPVGDVPVAAPPVVPVGEVPVAAPPADAPAAAAPPAAAPPLAPSAASPAGYAAPGYAQPTPGYTQPTPGYAQPAPGYAPATPGYTQPAPGYAQPAPGYTPPPAQPPRRGLPLGAILGIAGGGLALLLVIVLVVVFVIVPRVSGPGGADATPDGVVGAYLKAVSTGHAKTALSYLDRKPTSDDSLLTDGVLARSEKLGALKGIKVEKPASVNQFGTNVIARYSVGGKPVSSTFMAIQDREDKTWKVERGTSTLDLGDQFDSLALTINGQAVKGDTFSVFPGTYELGTTSKYFTLGDDATFAMTGPDDFPDLGDIRPALTDAGVTAFRTAVTAAVNACVASTTLQAGCGLSLQATSGNGYTINEGTVKRTLSADAQTALANLKPETDFLDPKDVTGDYIGEVDVDAQCTSGPCSLIGGEDIAEPHVDFTTDPPTVRW